MAYNDATAVALLYQGILGRQIEPAAVYGTVNALRSGMPFGDWFQRTLNSDEYEAHSTGYDDAHFVQSLYQNMLHRNPEPGVSWSHLPGTAGRADAAYVVASSPEYQNQYNSYSNREYARALYTDKLGRPGSDGEIASWAYEIDNGSRGRLDAAWIFTHSPEYENRYIRPDNSSFVSQLYHEALGRDPDSNSNYWVDQLNSGASRVDVAYGIVQSPEAHAHLASLWNDWHLT